MAPDESGLGDPPARRPMAISQGGAARAYLECIAGPEKGETFRVAPGVTTIGREPSCEVALTESVVSRQHARIDRRGDEWSLTNLSTNGTRLNKNSIDEAVLADGDVIHVGAKTRLRFVVETVAISPTGRPQFRARTGAPESEPAAGEVEQAEQEQPSLFQRRKGLFIGLGVYLLVVLIIGVVLALRGNGGSDTEAIPRLTREDMIRPAPGAKPLRIISESESFAGIWCETELGERRLVPYADLRSGKAKRIDGIRSAIEVKFADLPVNLTRAELHMKKALNLYDQRYSDPANLFGAVRNFQKALACSGRSYFVQPPVDRIYRSAVEDLVESIYAEYTNAILLEKAGDFEKALQALRRVQAMVPDQNNLIFDNVSLRMRAVRKHIKKKR